MIHTYHAAYRRTATGYLAVMLDVPGVVSFGETLPLARARLAGALEDLARWTLGDGRALPKPNPRAARPSDELAEVVETLCVMEQGGPPPIVTVPVPRT